MSNVAIPSIDVALLFRDIEDDMYMMLSKDWAW